MATKRPWRTAVLVAVGWLAGWSAITAQASEIRDDAGLFSPSVVTSATENLNELEKRDNLPVLIETHASIPADKQDAFGKLEKADKAKFFEKWTRERAAETRTKGLFVLITKSPGHVHYLVTEGLKQRGFEHEKEKALEKKFLENFQNKKFDEGLTAAVGYLGTVAPTLKTAKPATQGGYHPRPVQHLGQNPLHQDQNHQVAPVAPARADGIRGWGLWTWVILAVVVWLVFRVIVGLTRSATGGGMPPGPGYGGAGYPQPGYGGGYGGGGGGGFMSNMMGGLAGAVAGNWIYNSMFGSHNSAHGADWSNSGSGDNSLMGGGSSDGYTGGGDFGGGDFGGGDFGGGDSGGGDFGGGDFGGGDSGGGDF